MRASGDGGQRHLLVIVIQDVEAAVAAVSQAVQAQHQFGQGDAVRGFVGEDAEVARCVQVLCKRGHFLPHEVGNLDKENLAQVCECGRQKSSMQKVAPARKVFAGFAGPQLWLWEEKPVFTASAVAKTGPLRPP